MDVYLDNNATTSLDDRVLSKMEPYLTFNYANPSSTHRLGQKSRTAIDEAREVISGYINADPVEIIFTSSATESNNMAIRGISFNSTLPHIISTEIEHPSVLQTILNMERSGKCTFSLLRVNQTGHITSEDILPLIREETSLLSIQYSNSEIGTIQPICDIGRIASEKKILFHSDATQAFKYLPIDVSTDKVNMMTISAHKFNGPKGIAALYVKKNTPMSGLITGGNQEYNLRAGTENVANIVGFGEAVRILSFEREERNIKVKNIRDYFETKLISKIKIRINGSEPRISNVSSVTFPKISADTFLARLDMEGIYASSGVACASGSIQTSNVLVSLGIGKELADSTVRFSFSHQNTIQQIDFTIEKVVYLYKQLLKK